MLKAADRRVHAKTQQGIMRPQFTSSASKSRNKMYFRSQQPKYSELSELKQMLINVLKVRLGVLLWHQQLAPNWRQVEN